MGAKEDFGNEWNKNKNSKKYFKYGMLKRHLIIEAGSKFSNKLKYIKGDEPAEINNLIETINILKYELVEKGKVALIKSRAIKNNIYIGEVVDSNDFGTGVLHYLKVKVKTIKHKGEEFLIEEEFKLDPRTEELTKYVVKTLVTNISVGTEISIAQFNKLLGREFYKPYEILTTGYIPATIFFNSYDGLSDMDGLEEIFLLERQLLKEIPRDMDLSRKKVLYKTRLAGKSKEDLEVEMTEDSIVVWNNGNAVFTSPIDLWSPALASKTITETIDWLVNYTLKMKFAAKDSMATGAQKTDEQISEINQAAQNYVEEKKQMWGHYMTEFLRLITNDKEVEVEFELMTTVDRLVNGVETPVGGASKTPPKKEVGK